MKTTYILSALVMWCTASLAQVEGDDMYFNKKDRSKLIKEASTLKPAMEEALAKGEKPLRFDYTINKNSTPNSSTTSSREINPEYIARSQSQLVAGEEESYFIENYQFAKQQQLNSFSDSIATWANNPLYSSNYFAPSINGWNSPYYAPYNDPFLTGYSSNPWCNNSLQSGFYPSLSFAWNWGSNWNYGMGSSLSIYWSNVWMQHNMNLSLGFGYGYGYGNGYYNPAAYITGVDSRTAVYGKRGSRNGVRNSDVAYTSPGYSASRTSNSYETVKSGSGDNRAASRHNATDYYTPQWKRVTQQSLTPASTSQNRVSSTNSDLFQNRSSSSPSRSSNNFSAPAQRSGNSSSFSTPSRSSNSGGSSGAGSSGSRSSRSGGN